jgi:hypothetical protein
VQRTGGKWRIETMKDEDVVGVVGMNVKRIEGTEVREKKEA